MSDTTVAPPAAAAPNIAPDAPTPPNAPVAPPVAAPAPTTPPAVETPKPAAVAAEAESPALTKFKALATEIGLDDAKSSKLTEFYGSMQVEASKATEAAYAKQDAEWEAALAADPEFGGTNVAATKASALKAAAQWGGPELVRVLENTGLIKHPVVAKALAKISKANAEDSVAGTSSSGSGEPDDAALIAALYPNTKFSPAH